MSQTTSIPDLETRLREWALRPHVLTLRQPVRPLAAPLVATLQVEVWV